MNQDKAREFFSAYYEDTLEPGLKQAFELRLRSDSTLQADYAGFVETMMELDILADEEIEVPIFLSDRIATRIEQERARRKTGAPAWAFWLRGLGLAGLGAAAIGGAFLSLHNTGGRANTANFVGMPNADGDQLSFTGNGSAVMLSYHPSVERTVVVSSGINGKELERFSVNASSPAHPFENHLDGTALFQIQVQGEASPSLLALPGAVNNQTPTGEGTIREFAVALAGRYHMPVVLRTSEAVKRFSWKLEGVDPRRAATAALSGDSFVIDQRENGILNIMDR